MPARSTPAHAVPKQHKGEACRPPEVPLDVGGNGLKFRVVASFRTVSVVKRLYFVLPDNDSCKRVVSETRVPGYRSDICMRLPVSRSLSRMSQRQV